MPCEFILFLNPKVLFTHGTISFQIGQRFNFILVVDTLYHLNYTSNKHFNYKYEIISRSLNL